MKLPNLLIRNYPNLLIRIYQKTKIVKDIYKSDHLG